MLRSLGQSIIIIIATIIMIITTVITIIMIRPKSRQLITRRLGQGIIIYNNN